MFLLIFNNDIKVIEKSDNYQINITYPKTKYDDLNIYIDNLLNRYISMFKYNSFCNSNNNVLIIDYDKKKFKDIVIYNFYIRNLFDGNSYSNFVYTVSYNTYNRKIISNNYD